MSTRDACATQTWRVTPPIDPPSRLQFPVRQSTIRSSRGGIAQLVERQLCKLEVRGSNPLASSLRSHRSGERRLSRRSFQRRRTAFHLATPTQRATTRQASDEKWQILLHLQSTERARR